MKPIAEACLKACLTFSVMVAAVAAGDEPSKKPDGPFVRMLRGGKLPEDRQGTVIEMMGKRGNTADLDFLLELAMKPDGVSPTIRRKALGALSTASQTRGVRPEGDPGRLSGLIASKADPVLRAEAVRLSGFWKSEALAGPLRATAEAPDTPAALRASALDAMASIGGGAIQSQIAALTAADKPASVRVPAVVALARLDAGTAAARAVELIRDAGKDEDLAPLIAAFLNRRGGAETLAGALGTAKVSPDAAKLALRAVYVLGRSDPALVDALTKAARINTDVKPIDKTEMDRLLAEVADKGDPARGETIFRRADLNCTKCHAVSGAGGGVGPDLSPLGSSSPVDYIVNSIMLPDQAIKEEYHTLVVQTTDGQVYTGIVVDKDDARYVLREATGEHRTIPTSDVEDSKEGGSLMPKGLVNFMTRAEFVDLVRFLSELGKPGPYAIRSTPTVQRWRYLKPLPGDLGKGLPDAGTFGRQVLDADPSHWLPAYGKVAGDLPLDELTAVTGEKILYLQADVDVSERGRVTLKLDSAEGVRVWVDDKVVGVGLELDLTTGLHKLTFRVDTAARRDRALRVEVQKPAGSSVQYAVVGGR